MPFIIYSSVLNSCKAPLHQALYQPKAHSNNRPLSMPAPAPHQSGIVVTMATEDSSFIPLIEPIPSIPAEFIIDASNGRSNVHTAPIIYAFPPSRVPWGAANSRESTLP